MTSKQLKSTNRDHTARSETSAVGNVLFWIGAALLLVACGASLVLALDHFDISRAPGCGAHSGCDRATRGPWGQIPWLNWPVSLVGVAYFGGLLAAWFVSKGVLSTLLRSVIVLGGLGSIVFLGVMVAGGYLCKYCAAVHVANFAVIVIALSRTHGSAIHAAPIRRRDVASAVVAFIALTTVLAVINWQTAQTRQSRAQAELARTTQQIIEKTASAGGQPLEEQGSAAAVYSPPGGFTGRWRIGPENAPIRIVIFSDFQCSDCRAFEAQVRDLMARRQDVSVSAKHFPLCADCNSYVPKTMHVNACWGARAAEAAGILQGNDGFWKMHHWLFNRAGNFSNPELTSALIELGFEPQRFIEVMTSEATMQAVRADVEEGYALGLFFTPMVFINGVELRGFYGNSQALRTAVEAVAASNPPPGSSLDDKPPLAGGKLVGDWRESTARTLPPKPREWSLGDPGAPVQVWVWGDYQLAHTAELDQIMRASVGRRKDIHYIYRHYPLDQSCNAGLPSSFSNAGCWAARAAEAAGSVGGADAYWKMHEWLMNNQSSFHDAALREAAPQLGLDATALIAAMNSPEIEAIVSRDISYGKQFILQGVPTIFVNGRWVARWKFEKLPVLEMIFDEAAQPHN